MRVARRTGTGGVGIRYRCSLLLGSCGPAPRVLAAAGRGQGRGADHRTEAEIVLGGSIFRVQSYGLGRYPYRLDHENGVIGVTDSEKMPASRFSPERHSSMAWAQGGNRMVPDSPGERGRTDSADVQSNGPSFGLAGLETSRATIGLGSCARPAARVLYEDGGEFTGFVFGKRKTKTILARIYDKTVEIKQTGNAYWEDIWGPSYDKTSQCSEWNSSSVVRACRSSGSDSRRGHRGRCEALDGCHGMVELSESRRRRHEIPMGRRPRMGGHSTVGNRRGSMWLDSGLRRASSGATSRRSYRTSRAIWCPMLRSSGSIRSRRRATELVRSCHGFCASRGLSFEKRACPSSQSSGFHERRSRLGTGGRRLVRMCCE